MTRHCSGTRFFVRLRSTHRGGGMSADGSVDLRRQVQAHLASLQAAGVLFVPRGAAIVRPEVTAPQAAVVAAATVPEPVDPLENRQRELTVLADEVAACNKCNE